MDIFLDNRDGNVWQLAGAALANEENAAGIVSELSWQTERMGSPGTLELTLVTGGIYQNKKFKISNGDIIRVTEGNNKIFYGYVFKLEYSEAETIYVTAYDQLRYLKNKDTYVFKNVNIGKIIKRIAGDFGLKVGDIVEPKYTVPAMVEDNQSLFDIITKALSYTISATGTIFVLYDDFGKLTFKSAAQMALSFSIGDDSLATGFKFSRSIDGDTYNYFKLVRSNEKTGKRDTYIARNRPNIAKWGRLQYFDVVDEKSTPAQIELKLDQLAQLYGREGKTFSIEAIGDWRVRAGCYIPVFIEALGAKNNFLIERCSHKVEGNDHTMSLDLRAI